MVVTQCYKDILLQDNFAENEDDDLSVLIQVRPFNMRRQF
jgi:hypothetical protein